MKNGGKLLLVGDGVSDLPKEFVNHPQIILWDYQKFDKIALEKKEIPSNTKVIVYNRWVSHSLSDRLNKAAADLHAIKFPMMRNREIKELLYTFVQAEPLAVPAELVEQTVDHIVQEETAIESAKEVLEKVEEIMPATQERGFLRTFLTKHLNLNKDYTVKGSIKQEADRLFAKAKADGIKTTIGSVNQGISVIIKEVRDNKTKPEFKSEHGKTESLASHVKPTKTKSASVDDFTELEKLIQDAIVAMKLVQEHLPKVRKETERLRGLREKFLKLLE